jgi:membrane fusion protein, multidrug efflux system
VVDGLQPGESVVVDGADRLRDGAKVTIASEGGSQEDVSQPQAAAGQGPASTADPESATAPQSTQPQSRQHQGQGGGRRSTQ